VVGDHLNHLPCEPLNFSPVYTGIENVFQDMIKGTRESNEPISLAVPVHVRVHVIDVNARIALLYLLEGFYFRGLQGSEDI
jgi:hypothetical protein